MTDNSSEMLIRLTEASLKKCLGRLSNVSAGTWEILGITASRGTLEDAVKQHEFRNPAAGAVYFSLGGFPLTALMLLDPTEMECISKCYMGYSFTRGTVTTAPEEVMLLELGNIILNAVINSALNALKKSGMPSVPAYLEGDQSRLLEGLGASVGLKKTFHIITATLAIRSDKCLAKSEVLALIPDELVPELPAA
jgi:hypothetical protein